MRRAHTLVIIDSIHQLVKKHLFPGDGLEAAAILLCKRMTGNQTKLLCTKAIYVPYAECSRSSDQLTWPGEYLAQALDEAENESLSLILIHSHPGNLNAFSLVDDRSDRLVIPELFKNSEAATHGTAIMVPNGSIKARMYDQNQKITTVDLVAVYGTNTEFFWDNSDNNKRPLAFTEEMRNELSKLTVAVIGCSGTGSITAEQLARIGIGKIIAVDFDQVEKRNLNRILNSTIADAECSAFKVDVFKRAASTFRSDLVVENLAESVVSREAVIAIADADIIFSCVDSLIGRAICDLMSQAFLQPLYDVGVTIPVGKLGHNRTMSIIDINGRIDYVKPGGPTLKDREVYDSKSLAAEELKERDPLAHAEQVEAGYMPGSTEQAPSVISVNMLAASLCVQEFIARLYPFRLDSNDKYARTLFSLGEGEFEYFNENTFGRSNQKLLGSGLSEPLLGLPVLGENA